MHFTHIRNLPGILAASCLQSDNLLSRQSVAIVEAADPVIKARRRQVRIRLAPFGCVADYVPFYFAPRSPMLYKLARGGVPSYTDGQDSLIYFVGTVERIADTGLRYIFSDGNCAASVTQLFNDLRDLETAVDWALMRVRMWNDTAEDPDRMRRRMAEFLVHERVPVRCLARIVVRTPAMKRQVVAILVEHGISLSVEIRPGWYF
jgi:ssDNA thymidine ADP-ribosyltransferase, DarT